MIKQLFLLALILRILLAVFNPVWNNADELAHASYVDYIHNYHAIPIVEKYLGNTPPSQSNLTYEYHQPFLYYGMVATLPNSVIVWRLFSVFLWSASAIFFWLGLKQLKIPDKQKVFAFCVMCFLPTLMAVTSAVTNDGLIIFFGCVLFWLLSTPPVWRKSIAISVCIALAVMTKMNSFLLFIPVVVYFWSDKKELLRILGISAVLCLPFVISRLMNYGSFTLSDYGQPHVVWQSMSGYFYRTFLYITGSVWAIAGASDAFKSPMLIYFGKWIGLLAIIAVWIKKDKSIVHYSAIWSLLVGVVFLFWVGYEYNMPQGRIIFPLIPYVAILLSCSLELLPPQITSKGIALSFSIIGVIFTSMFLGVF